MENEYLGTYKNKSVYLNNDAKACKLGEQYPEDCEPVRMFLFYKNLGTGKGLHNPSRLSCYCLYKIIYGNCPKISGIKKIRELKNYPFMTIE